MLPGVRLQATPDAVAACGVVVVVCGVVVVEAEKLAVTFLAADMVTVQVGEVPEQSPDQFAKVELAAGEAVRVTLVPEVYGAEQVAPQSIPEGLELTVPLPFFVTDNVYGPVPVPPPVPSLPPQLPDGSGTVAIVSLPLPSLRNCEVALSLRPILANGFWV